MADETTIETACAHLAVGASLGSERAFATLDRESNLDALWWADGRYHAGALRLDFTRSGHPLPPVATRFEPDSQTTIYRCSDLTVQKQAFLDLGRADPRTFCLTITATSSRSQTSVLGATLRFRPAPSPGTGHRKEPSQRDQAVRFTCATIPGGFRLTPLDDPDCPVDLLLPAKPLEWTWAHGEALAVSLALPVPPSGAATWTLALGPATATRMPAADAQARSLATLNAACPLQCHCSEAQLEGALQWAQVNAYRVRHRFAAGWGFTNDPPGDILVLRDAAWFVAGADWFDPVFAGRMLDVLMDHGVDADGKAVEFLCMTQDPPGREDYGLALNDDTPLLLWALSHHAEVTGDGQFTRAAYAVGRRLGQYLLNQKVGGLLWARGKGTGVYGITGWRNIIPGYRLDGAVTEVNAEGVGAFRGLARLASLAGDDAGALHWARAASELQTAMERELYDSRQGRYLLARSPEGMPIARRTGDLLFPLLFGVTGPDEERKLLADLAATCWWTQRGMRTVPCDDSEYDPVAGAGLLGGSWPNLTLWFAAAAAAADPQLAAAAFASVTAVLQGPPPQGAGRVVPGQFPEWFDGQTLESRGMALSPWVGPTVVWALVEGLAGLAPDGPGLRIRHGSALAHLALAGLQYRGRSRHLVLTPRRAISDIQVAGMPCETFEQAQVCTTHGPGWALRFRRGSEVLTVAGSALGGLVRVSTTAAGATTELRLEPGDLVEWWGSGADPRTVL